MKNLTSIFSLLTFCFLISCSSVDENQTKDEAILNVDVEALDYAVDSGQYITWKAKHNDDSSFAYISTLGISRGSITVEDQQISKAKFAFDIASMSDTNLPNNLIKHLKGSDYFNVDEFPQITFYINESNNNTISGELSVVGIKQKIDFPAEITFSENGLNAAAEFELDMLVFAFPHLVKTHQKSPEDKKTGPSNLVTIAFDISASLLN
tara:strand:- start:464 stop:1090 length:627 start_codon:yes stop_codon:yes gene_type:complete